MTGSVSLSHPPPGWRPFRGVTMLRECAFCGKAPGPKPWPYRHPHWYWRKDPQDGRGKRTQHICPDCVGKKGEG
jgi:hypothetical protein